MSVNATSAVIANCAKMELSLRPVTQTAAYIAHGNSTSLQPRPDIALVVFDFDGTLSWLRHGWPELMHAVLRPHFTANEGESAAAFDERLFDEIYSHNGVPTADYMRLFAVRFGSQKPLDPDQLLASYSLHLEKAIAERSAMIRSGARPADDFIVHGAVALLQMIRDRGIELAVLSGTLQHRVVEEAGLLGLSHFFGGRIVGSTIDGQFTKRAALEQFLAARNLCGAQLLSFGDGAVEIRETKALGGLAVAVASDEHHNGSGTPDFRKERSLISAGADCVIADYRDPAALLKTLLGE